VARRRGPIPIRTTHDPHPTAKAFIDACRQMRMPILRDVNGPMREGAGYVNMTIAPDGSEPTPRAAFCAPVSFGRTLPYC